MTAYCLDGLSRSFSGLSEVNMQDDSSHEIAKVSGKLMNELFKWLILTIVFVVSVSRLMRYPSSSVAAY